MSEKKWMSSGFALAAPTGEINDEKGIISGVSVCTVGEAKGHGVSLDSEFIGTVAELGNAKTQGLKARYGHPNMCSTALGTFIGRFKNFSVVGEQVIADLFLSNSAKETPNGDLYSYILNLAADEPDMFGTSIVFTQGAEYKRNENGDKVYPRLQSGEWNEEFDTAGGHLFVECEKLHACDMVDEPAANDGGLFSKFAQETVAGQITQFLDLNPTVWDALQSNPSILEALGRYGDKMDEFTTRYREYREHSKEGGMPNKEEMEAAALAEKEAEELKLKEQADKEATELAAKEAEDKEAAELAEKEEAERLEAEKKAEELEGAQFDVAEFARITEAFGAEIAAKTVSDGGDYSTALEMHSKALEAENEALKTRISELETGGGGTPAKARAAAEPKKPLIIIK